MHGILQRSTAVFYGWLTALTIMSLLISFGSFYYFDVDHVHSLDMSSQFLRISKCSAASRNCPESLKRLSRATGNKKLDYIDMKLDAEVDMSPLFHWNTKQVFVWISAEYETDSFQSNVVSLWDHIFVRDVYDELVMRKQPRTKFAFRPRRPKYLFKELEDSLLDQTVNITLNWDIMPFVGFVQPSLSKGSVSMHLSSEYS